MVKYNIHVKDLPIETRVGVHEIEKIHPQKIVFNVYLTINTCREINNLADTICYDRFVQGMCNLVCAGGHRHLLETLVQDVLCFCMQQKSVSHAKVSATKTPPTLSPGVVTITMERSSSS